MAKPAYFGRQAFIIIMDKAGSTPAVMEVFNLYTWGYIKDAALAKLDLEQDEANELKLINRFIFYANEVITQISSAIKPKRLFYELLVTEDMVGKLQTLDDPMFIGFGDDVSTITYDIYNARFTEECHDDILVYKGYNQFICYKAGLYHISYKARWITFNEDIKNHDVLDVPTDILECIPSYIAHQCYKIDDEYKSSVFRNEYEMFLARIDDTNFKTNTTFKIGGDW